MFASFSSKNKELEEKRQVVDLASKSSFNEKEIKDFKFQVAVEKSTKQSG